MLAMQIGAGLLASAAAAAGAVLAAKGGIGRSVATATTTDGDDSPLHSPRRRSAHEGVAWSVEAGQDVAIDQPQEGRQRRAAARAGPGARPRLATTVDEHEEDGDAACSSQASGASMWLLRQQLSAGSCNGGLPAVPKPAPAQQHLNDDGGASVAGGLTAPGPALPQQPYSKLELLRDGMLVYLRSQDTALTVVSPGQRLELSLLQLPRDRLGGWWRGGRGRSRGVGGCREGC